MPITVKFVGMITDGQPHIDPLSRGPEDPRCTQLALRQPMELMAIDAPEVHLNFDIHENLVELMDRPFRPDPTMVLQNEVRYLANLAAEAFARHSNSLQDLYRK